MLNHVTMMGRLVREPELRHTQSGIPVCTCRIAVDRDYASQNGDRETDFFDVVAWRGTAEFISKYFSKGRMIALDGRLQTQSWTDRDGNNRTSTGIVAESVYFADSKRESVQENVPEPAQVSTAAKGTAAKSPARGRRSKAA